MLRAVLQARICPGAVLRSGVSGCSGSLAALACPPSLAEDGQRPRVPSATELPVSPAGARTAGGGTGHCRSGRPSSARGSAPIHAGFAEAVISEGACREAICNRRWKVSQAEALALGRLFYSFPPRTVWGVPPHWGGRDKIGCGIDAIAPFPTSVGWLPFTSGKTHDRTCNRHNCPRSSLSYNSASNVGFLCTNSDSIVS